MTRQTSGLVDNKFGFGFLFVCMCHEQNSSWQNGGRGRKWRWGMHRDSSAALTIPISTKFIYILFFILKIHLQYTGLYSCLWYCHMLKKEGSGHFKKKFRNEVFKKTKTAEITEQHFHTPETLLRRDGEGVTCCWCGSEDIVKNNEQTCKMCL